MELKYATVFVPIDEETLQEDSAEMRRAQDRLVKSMVTQIEQRFFNGVMVSRSFLVTGTDSKLYVVTVNE